MGSVIENTGYEDVLGRHDGRGRELIGTDEAHDFVMREFEDAGAGGAPGGGDPDGLGSQGLVEGHVIYGVDVADSYLKRLRGLMGAASVAPGYMLFFPDCASIHCMFMRVPIDVIYLSADFVVLGVETVRPWRIGHAPSSTAHVCECAAGQAEAWEIAPGDTLRPLCASRQAAGAAWSFI